GVGVLERAGTIGGRGEDAVVAVVLLVEITGGRRQVGAVPAVKDDRRLVLFAVEVDTIAAIARAASEKIAHGEVLDFDTADAVNPNTVASLWMAIRIQWSEVLHCGIVRARCRC